MGSVGSIEINVVWGVGEGITTVSAFDKALFNCGVHNFNLSKLSSIIPVGSMVHKLEKYDSSYEVGSILEAVLSEHSSDKPGELISAGLGWVITESGGIFLEHSLIGSKSDCEKYLSSGLDEMISSRGWEPIIKDMIVIEHTVKSIGSIAIVAMYNIRRCKKGEKNDG